MLESIRRELGTSLDIVSGHVDDAPTTVTFGRRRTISLSTDAFDAAVSSGGFALLEIAIQGDLSRTYRSVRRAVDGCTRLLDANSSGITVQTNYESIMVNLQRTLDGDLVGLQRLISASISGLGTPTDQEK